ncbi:hypothetical protein AcV7_001975 [Taiwanofungus camphoratus]|nr:hypothetical protein AcV7_001975 [Antrodia cinnamomea]
MQASLLVRSPIARRALIQPVRCLASKAPPPRPPLRNAPPTPTSALATPEPSSSLPSLDFAPSTEETQERTGARSSKNSLSSIERRRRFLARGTLVALLLGTGASAWYIGREWEEAELKAKRMRIEDAPSTRWGRTKTRFTSLFDFFTEPLWPELLPPPHPAIPQKPYTLLVSIDDLLVTSTWDRHHGWRTAKRPGVDYFLGYLSQFYEVVIFTTQYNYTAAPILDKLDPYQFFITYRLYRDACRSVQGEPVKDLTYLNRDLSKVVILDAHPEHVSAQPENAIVLPKWTGDPKDKGLVAMIPFLECTRSPVSGSVHTFGVDMAAISSQFYIAIGIYKPPDVRPILDAYRGKDIPLEYAKKEAEMKQKHIDEWQKNRKGFSTGAFTLSSLFGGPSQANASPIPLTYLEQKRREAQTLYQDEQAYIRANKETFERLIKEDQEAMAKEMSGGTFWSAAEALIRGGPPPKKGTPVTASLSEPSTNSATTSTAGASTAT